MVIAIHDTKNQISINGLNRNKKDKNFTKTTINRESCRQKERQIDKPKKTQIGTQIKREKEITFNEERRHKGGEGKEGLRKVWKGG